MNQYTRKDFGRALFKNTGKEKNVKNRSLLRKMRWHFILVVLGIVVYLFVGQAKTDEIAVSHYMMYIDAVTGATPTPVIQAELKYDPGALEGKDPNDIEVPSPYYVDILGSSDIEGTKHTLVAKPLNSTTDTQFDFEEIYGDLDVEDEKWKFSITKNNGATDWKNIFFVRYGTSDPTDPDNILGMWDVKYNDGANPDDYYGYYTSGGPFYIGPPSLYDRTVFQVFNYADLNRDKKVNLTDFGILSYNWLRTGIDKGSDPFALNDYADIDGDGVVGVNDLSSFVIEWLWDADNP